jgi:hypothetical protein
VTLEDLVSRLGSALERAKVPYMVTGSVASSAHGTPRSTRDLDIVIAPTQAQLLALMREFPGSHYYADEHQALQALANRSQFNVIDFATGWKVDFIIAEDSEYGRAALNRRRRIDVAGNAMCVASAEDVIIAKMQWARLGASDRQLQDAAGILSVQATNLDFAYVERWVHELRLETQWRFIRERSSSSPET